MIIAIDARAWAWAGVGRYVRNLITCLAEIDHQNEYIILIGREDESLYQNSQLANRARNIKLRLVDSSYYSWREQVVFWRQAEKVRADLYHFPNFNVPIMFSRPYVVTVHDITRFVFPGQRAQGLVKQVVYEHVFKRAVERSAGVIFVSRSTRDELKGLPIKVPRITGIIHEGVDSGCLEKVQDCDRREIRAKTEGRKYLLYVGVWMNHKNLPRLLEAFALVAKKYNDVDLVLTGQAKKGYVDVKQYVKRLRLDDKRVRFIGQVKESLLPALYAEASMLVYPSLYEGFGLPAIEAAACGTPVVVANVTSLPEIMGEAAAYVNPESTQDIAQKIDKLLKDVNYRRDLIARGRYRATQFNWQDCARQTLSFYQRVMSDRAINK